MIKRQPHTLTYDRGRVQAVTPTLADAAGARRERRDDHGRADDARSTIDGQPGDARRRSAAREIATTRRRSTAAPAATVRVQIPPRLAAAIARAPAAGERRGEGAAPADRAGSRRSGSASPAAISPPRPGPRPRRLRLMAGHVLLVEDEPSVGELVRGYLARDGWTVIWVRSGEEALVELDRHPVRIVILDIGLPGIDGFEVCREMRARSRVPILMLTARDEEPDRIVGLEVGADDYLTKPFSPRELVARMKAILRRSEPQPTQDLLELGDVSLNRETHDVTIAGDAGRADREGVRPARVLPLEPRRGALARRPARPRLGRRLSRRHAHGRRPRRPAAPQARPARADPDAARQRLQGGQRLKTLRRPALRGDARRARADAHADDRDRRRPHAGSRSTRPRSSALARPGRQRRAARRQSVSYINSNTRRRAASARSSSPRSTFAGYVPDVNRSSNGDDDLPGQARTSTRTGRSRRAGCCCSGRRARSRPPGIRSSATCCSRRSPAPRSRRRSRSWSPARSSGRCAGSPTRATRSPPARRRRRCPRTGARELASLAQAFNEMAEQLAASRESERNFLLSVSHELKTPLTAIRGYAEGLAEGAFTPDEASRTILRRGAPARAARARPARSRADEPARVLGRARAGRPRRGRPRGGRAARGRRRSEFGVALAAEGERVLGRGRPRPAAPGRLEPGRERAARDAARRARSTVRAEPAPARRLGHRARASSSTTCRTPSTASSSTTSTAASARSGAASASRSSSSSPRRWAAASTVESTPGAGRDVRRHAAAGRGRSRGRRRLTERRSELSTGSHRRGSGTQLRGVDDLEVGAGEPARGCGGRRSTSAGPGRR